MKTNVDRSMAEAAATLKNGGLVAFPTDTVYGLGALAVNIDAVRRIFVVKKRSRSQPLPLLLADTRQVDEVAVDIPDVARRLMQAFWPGPLTIVLKKAASVPLIVTAGGDSVAVRVPGHQLSRALIRRAGGPVVGTSANISGRPSPVTAEEVRKQLGSAVDYILNGGTTKIGCESTIVDATTTPPRLLRPGSITRQELEKITPIA